MKNFRALLASLIPVFVLCLSAGNTSANTVYGEVFFDGRFTGNARVFGAMTRFNSFSDVMVTGGNGSYQGLPSVPVSMQGFTFSTSLVLDNVWNFSIGDTAYSFDLSSVRIVSRNRSVMTLEGTGTAEISGLQSASGTWTLTANGTTKRFTAAFDPPANAVPDRGATTILLLAGATLLLVGLRRGAVRA